MLQKPRQKATIFLTFSSTLRLEEITNTLGAGTKSEKTMLAHPRALRVEEIERERVEEIQRERDGMEGEQE